MDDPTAPRRSPAVPPVPDPQRASGGVRGRMMEAPTRISAAAEVSDQSLETLTNMRAACEDMKDAALNLFRSIQDAEKALDRLDRAIKEAETEWVT